jgi:AcrR family transcriptional regulator
MKQTDTYEHNKKFQNIAKTAKELFWKHGIRRVSIEEICTQAAVSKMTFYKFFKNKEVLATYILDKVMKGWQLQYRAIMDDNSRFTSKIEQMIELKRQVSEEMSEAFMDDIINKEFVLLQERLNEYRTTIIADFVKELSEAQARGELRSNIKPEFILYMLDELESKFSDEKLAGIYPSKQAMIMELTSFFFYGIMNENP